MAPEAFNGRRSEQTDLWSVGILLYQLLTGGLPFQQSDVASLIKAIVLDTPIRLPSLFPDSLQRIVDCALQKDLARRYRSAGEMRIALQEAIKPTSQNKKKLASRKLYVGNLSFRVSAQDLLELFLQVGIVESASVVEDSETGRARGFGFVEMSTPEEAEYAMEMFNGKEFFGRNLIVNEAKRENLRRDRMPTW
jgi:serine/threonine protein kinase